MNLFRDVLRFLSVASLGLFVGAMLTEGFVLVPYWRSLSPEEFFQWYAANDKRLLGFFGPLTTVAALLAVAAAIASLWEGHPGRWPALIAAALSIVVVSTFTFTSSKPMPALALPPSASRLSRLSWLAGVRGNGRARGSVLRHLLRP